MVGKMKRRIGIMFFAMLCVMAIACACTIRKTPDDTTAPETTNSETTKEPVRETTPTPTPTKKPTSEPTPTPTKKPTATPTPTPASVYIPREELPDGQLFEKGFYAVLPGEGAYYNVFDCYGKQVASFTFSDADREPPIGIFTEQSLAQYYRFNESKVQSIIPENEYGHWIFSNENGFYEIDYEEDQVILYNKSGKYIQTVRSESETARGDTYEWWDIVVSCYGEETVVSFSKSDWDPVSHSVNVYFVAADGTINDKCVAKDLPGKPFGLLGRKYLLIDKGDWDSTNCDIYAFDGELIIENVSVMEEYSSTLVSSEGVTFIRVSDYYMKDGITYDSSFSAVSKNKLDLNGNLIYGVEYDVDGITCTAQYWRQGHQYYSVFEPSELIAVGTKDGRTAIKTCDSEYVFDCLGEYYSMNDFVLVLTDKNDEKQVISLETGEVLYTINKTMDALVADEYIILVPLYPAEADYGYNHGTFILDKDGNVRYVSLIAYAKGTLGEYIVLNRGPYVGIADLNGEWIMKSLTWEITRDQEYVDPWE